MNDKHKLSCHMNSLAHMAEGKQFALTCKGCECGVAEPFHDVGCHYRIDCGERDPKCRCFCTCKQLSVNQMNEGLRENNCTKCGEFHGIEPCFTPPVAEEKPNPHEGCPKLACPYHYKDAPDYVPPLPMNMNNITSPTATPEEEKHECEQGTFCVECGMDNRPTSDWELRFDEEFTIDNGPTVEASIKDPNGMAGPIKAFIRQIEAQAKEEGRREGQLDPRSKTVMRAEKEARLQERKDTLESVREAIDKVIDAGQFRIYAVDSFPDDRNGIYLNREDLRNGLKSAINEEINKSKV